MSRHSTLHDPRNSLHNSPRSPSLPRVLCSAAITALGLALGLSRLAACGGNVAECGNSIVETDEDCDKGAQNGQKGVNCSAECKSISVPIGQVRVSWGVLKKTGVEGYGGGGCSDIGAVMAHVQIAGPTPFDEMRTCTEYGHLYSGQNVLGGTYKVTITLVDAGGNPVTKPVTSTEQNAIVGGETATLPVDFGVDAFLKAYTGSFQLRASWGVEMATCTTAMPVVEQETIKLVPMGASTPLTGATKLGTPLDGTPNACQIPGQEIYEKALDLPVGQYRLQVQGISGGKVSYCKAQDIFIGPSKNSQPWSIIIPAAGADGGTCD